MDLIIKNNKSYTQLILLSILFISVTSCSSVNVSANQASLADDTTSKTVVSYWWGISDVQEKVDCNGNGLKIVRISTNWLYSFCTVVTLGAVVPLEIEYRCTTGGLQGGETIGIMKEGENDKNN